MAKKKKKTTKKHQFIHKEAKTDVIKKDVVKPIKSKLVRAHIGDKSEVENVSHIKRDLTHFIYISISLVVITIILYYVSENTNIVTNIFEKIDPR